MEIALFEPEIPQNTGTILRTAACMNMPVHIIEPCGFIWNHSSFKRSVMDYIDYVDVRRHVDFEAFCHAVLGEGLAQNLDKRMILCDVQGQTSLFDHPFQTGDVIVFGKESTGLPNAIKASYPSLFIPMPGAHKGEACRSLNLAVSVGMVVTQALRVAGS